MLLNPLLRLRMPQFFPKHVRTVRPTLKIDNEEFYLTINVNHFCKDEIRVKARPEYVIIEGKQERKMKRGYICRSFVRKFKLPKGIRPDKIKTTLTSDVVSEKGALKETSHLTKVSVRTIQRIISNGPITFPRNRAKIAFNKIGVLTITAPIVTCEQSFPCETLVPIQSTDQKPPEESLLPPPADDKKNK